MNFLHLIVNTQSSTLSPSMITGILSGYPYAEVMPGYWIVKTNQAPSEFTNVLKSTLGNIPYALFRTDESSLLGGAIFPEGVRTFVESKQSAA